MKQINQDNPVRPVETRLKTLFMSGLGGDANAYRTFLADLSRHLRGFLRRRVSFLQDDIEDLVQEILLAVHNGRHTYRPNEPLTAWVHAIAEYKLIDLFRARSRRESLTDCLDDHDEMFADSDTEALDAKRDIGTLLDGLPDHHRLPIQHVKLEGLTVAETARLTGMSESAIKVGIHRGLKALTAMLGESMRKPTNR
jgi:RNA polymerase sigma factor (sigma-70 family)